MTEIDTDATNTLELPPLPAAVRKAIEGVQPLFRDFVKGFTVLASKREDVAPKFMKAFQKFHAVREGATFVDFCREVDPDIPVDRAGYKSHRAYQAADYLRRLYASQQAKKEGKQQPAGPAPAKPLDAFARVVASIFPVLPESAKETMWQAMRTELHWTEKQVERIKQMLDSVTPLIIATVPKGQELPVLKVRVKHQPEAEKAEKAA